MCIDCGSIMWGVGTNQQKNFVKYQQYVDSWTGPTGYYEQWVAATEAGLSVQVDQGPLVPLTKVTGYPDPVAVQAADPLPTYTNRQWYAYVAPNSTAGLISAPSSPLVYNSPPIPHILNFYLNTDPPRYIGYTPFFQYTQITYLMSECQNSDSGSIFSTITTLASCAAAKCNGDKTTAAGTCTVKATLADVCATIPMWAMNLAAQSEAGANSIPKLPQFFSKGCSVQYTACNRNDPRQGDCVGVASYYVVDLNALPPTDSTYYSSIKFTVRTDQDPYVEVAHLTKGSFSFSTGQKVRDAGIVLTAIGLALFGIPLTLFLLFLCGCHKVFRPCGGMIRRLLGLDHGLAAATAAATTPNHNTYTSIINNGSFRDRARNFGRYVSNRRLDDGSRIGSPDRITGLGGSARVIRSNSNDGTSAWTSNSLSNFVGNGNNRNSTSAANDDPSDIE